MNLIAQTIEVQPECIQLPARYSVPEATLAARDSLLAEMDLAIADIEQIQSAEQLQLVIDQGSQLQGHQNETKADRLTLARPINDNASMLLDLERSYLAPIVAALAKRERLLVDFRVRERDRIAAEERHRRAQLEKLEADRRAAEDLAAKAARGKKQIAAQILAEQQAHNLREEQEALIRAPLRAAVAAKGSTFRQKLCHKVTDIAALWAARPDLCNPPEAKLSAINATCDPARPVPGLELWWEDKGGFRR